MPASTTSATSPAGTTRPARRRLRRSALLVAAALAAGSVHAAPCTGRGVELQVLGSGSPETQARRAGTSYLVRQDGRPRVLVDFGAGSFVRFGEAGANAGDLDLVLFTHFHTDHAGDFPGLIKSSWFEDRSRDLPVLGPAGNRLMPSATEFLRGLFGTADAPFRYLSEFVVAEEASIYKLEPRDVVPGEGALLPAYDAGDLRAVAAEVIHGAIPALAWRVELAGRSVTFTGDGNGDNGMLEKLARGTDLLVAHNAVPEGIAGVARRLHAPPSVIGRIAAEAQVKAMVLSHRMTRTLGREEETLREIGRRYKGPVRFADDLDCFPVP